MEIAPLELEEIIAASSPDVDVGEKPVEDLPNPDVDYSLAQYDSDSETLKAVLTPYERTFLEPESVRILQYFVYGARITAFPEKDPRDPNEWMSLPKAPDDLNQALAEKIFGLLCARRICGYTSEEDQRRVIEGIYEGFLDDCFTRVGNEPDPNNWFHPHNEATSISDRLQPVLFPDPMMTTNIACYDSIMDIT